MIGALDRAPPRAPDAAPAVRNLVLVHGAFAAGFSWAEVWRILTRRGYRVVAAHLSLASLAADVAAVERLLDRLDGPAVLVGHDYGGAVITEAGARPEVAGLVYVAAFAPDTGESALSLSAAAPPGEDGLPPPAEDWIFYDRERLHAGLAADLPREQAEMIADLQAPVTVTALAAPVAAPAWRARPSWYLVAADDRAISPELQRWMAARAGAVAVEVAAGHAVQVSQPLAVADLIEAAVRSSPSPASPGVRERGTAREAEGGGG